MPAAEGQSWQRIAASSRRPDLAAAGAAPSGGLEGLGGQSSQCRAGMLAAMSGRAVGRDSRPTSRAVASTSLSHPITCTTPTA